MREHIRMIYCMFNVAFRVRIINILKKCFIDCQIKSQTMYTRFYNNCTKSRYRYIIVDLSKKIKIDLLAQNKIRIRKMNPR